MHYCIIRVSYGAHNANLNEDRPTGRPILSTINPAYLVSGGMRSVLLFVRFLERA